jgi:hypothetical protein
MHLSVSSFTDNLLDEFILSKVRNSPTNWVNKFGIQLGGKYIDAFGIKNLDLQLEMNRVRPFTYAHYDTINNYTHYNQPLAHPLGANFQELIGIARYQPFPKWNIYAREFFIRRDLIQPMPISVEIFSGATTPV